MIIIKHRARKALASAPVVSVGYANYSVPGMLQKKHMTAVVGDYIVRFSFEEIDLLHSRAQQYREGVAHDQ